MKEQIIHTAYKGADSVRRLYWNVAKPHRYGVKALIVHPEDPEQIVLIRQSYGDTTRFGLAGGGYNPKKESPEQAVRREVHEELGVTLGESLMLLSETESTAEGKTDHLSILGGVATGSSLHPNIELSEAKWQSINSLEVPEGFHMSKFVIDAVASYKQTL